MASSAPPILPTTVPAAIPTTTVPAAIPTTTVPAVIPTTTDPSAFRAFITRISDQLKDGLSQRRPWAELIDRSAFSKPESITDATTRIRKNYSYFRVNYLALLTLTIAVSLLTHPFSLITLLLLLSAWCFLYLFKSSDHPISILGRTFSDRETLGLLIIFSVFVVFLTNVGSVLMSAIVVGVGLVCAHAAFRQPEDLFLDDQDTASGANLGFLTFLGAATQSAAAGASAVPPPRA